MRGAAAWRPDAELSAALKQGCLIGAALAALILPPAGSASSRLSTHASWAAGSAAQPARPPRLASFGELTPSADARYLADWVADSRDNGSASFAILDKRDARVYVFDREAALVGSAPVLLGATPGDDSAAGIGQRPMDQVQQQEKTTPAGRFISAPGRNASGEDVIWVDYGAAVSMHRVRPVDPKERRMQRLASADPAQRRISYGCINVPVAFFEGTLQPTLAGGRSVVYVLPEQKPLNEVFASAYAAAARPPRP